MTALHARDIVKAADSAKDASIILKLLPTVAIGSAVVCGLAELGCLKRKPGKGSKVASGRTVPATNDALALCVAVIAGKVLDEALRARTVEGKVLRMSLIAELANEESDGAQPPMEVTQVAVQDEWLTTAQAAAALKTSRPYISMLCNSGKLGEVLMIDGRHRRVLASAVQAYLGGRAEKHETPTSPRQAGVDAGLYDHPDGYFVNAAREKERASKEGKKKWRAKPDRQSHR